MLCNKRIILVLLLLTQVAVLWGQVDKASRLFDQGRFDEAATLLEKAIAKDSSDNNAVIKLAMTYYQLREYPKSLEVMQWLPEKELTSGVSAEIYPQVLFANQRYEEALQFINNHSGKESDSLKKQIDLILEWSKGYQAGRVSPTFGLNTTFNEYAPFLMDSSLLILSDRPQQQTINPAAADVRYYSIYSTPYKNHGQLKFDKPVLFDRQIDNPFHDGPVYYCAKDSTLYLTRSSKQAYASKDHVDFLGIYLSKYKNGRWSVPVPFIYNSDSYNIAHPVMDDSENRLYFASDMPGTVGGMDLWYCERQPNGWSKPVNLGKYVNTPGQEVSPSNFANYIYFSSDGHGGYGNFDVFRTSIDKSYSDLYTMRAPLNSPYDDLCVFFMDETSAYFSSNRPGGLGGDDIYLYHVVEEATVFKSFKGQLLNSGLPEGTKLNLLNSNGEVIQTTELQADGTFEFIGVVGNASYTVQPEEAQVAEGAKMQLFNNHGDVVQEVTANKFGGFKFELLTPEDYDNLSLMAYDDGSILALDILGQLDADSTEMEGITIFIEDPSGNLLGQTYTDSTGHFGFKSLSPTDRYVIRANITDPNSTINVLNQEGDVIQSIRLSEDKTFVYVRLSENDKVITLSNDMKIRENENFNLPAIHYGFDEYELNSEGREQVDKLIRIIRENPNIKVVLSGHTDSKGSDSYNKKLSQKRIESVIAYMQAKGVDVSQVEGTGYGETQLLNECDDGVECTEEQHARNRRTEFKVIRSK